MKYTDMVVGLLVVRGGILYLGGGGGLIGGFIYGSNLRCLYIFNKGRYVIGLSMENHMS